MPQKSPKTALVVARFRSRVMLLGDDSKPFQAWLSKDLSSVLVGDRVSLSSESENAMVRGVLERDSVMPKEGRALVANAETLFFFQSKMPHTPWVELEKAFFSASQNGFNMHLIFNKIDLLTQEEQEHTERILSAFKRSSVKVSMISASSLGFLELATPSILHEKIMLLGASGVGKSTWVQKVLGLSDIKIGELTKEGRGRHTTTVPKIYLSPKGGWVIDLPGIGVDALLINPKNEKELKDYFAFDGEGECRFHDCKHLGEKDCAVFPLQQSLQDKLRFKSYQMLIKESDSKRKQRLYGNR